MVVLVVVLVGVLVGVSVAVLMPSLVSIKINVALDDVLDALRDGLTGIRNMVFAISRRCDQLPCVRLRQSAVYSDIFFDNRYFFKVEYNVEYYPNESHI